MKIQDILAPLKKALNGSAVAAFERAIAQLEEKRDAEETWFANFQRRRDELLLEGDTDALAILSAEKPKRQDELDAANVALKQIRARLADARNKARKDRWARIHDADTAALKEFFPKALAAYQAFVNVIGIRTEAEQQGYGPELRSVATLPHMAGHCILAPDLLQQAADMALRLDPKFGAFQFREATAKLPPRIKKEPAPGQSPSKGGRIFLGPPMPSRSQSAPVATQGEETKRSAMSDPGSRRRTPATPHQNRTAPRAPDDWSPLGSGEVRARVIRPGYSPTENIQNCAGQQIIKLPEDIAKRACANKAIEIVSENGPATEANNAKS